jgi:homocysteine S-methyltransferase
MQNESSCCILKKMPDNLLTRLKAAPVLCDGAMGTLLYSKGIFINRSYDELNVSQPELIHAVHQEYLQAGAETSRGKRCAWDHRSAWLRPSSFPYGR